MRLSLQRNKFLSMNPTYLKLNDMMKVRDPLYEAPPPTVDEIGGKTEK